MKNLIIAADGETMPAGAPIKEVFGVAYSGAEFTQPWEELPIVLDLAGLEIAPQVPLLYDHDNEPRMRLGVVEAAVEDNRLVIAGEIAATGEHGREVIEGGRLWPWQLSIGARVLASEVIEEPRTVNGREVANCLLITRAQLREVSVVAVGADKETHLDIAAAFGGKPPKKEEKTMEKEEKNTLDANADEKSAARVDGIAAALADHPETCAEAIRAGWSVAQAQSVAAALKKAESNVPPAVANINAGAEAESARRVLRGALELRAGIAPERTGLTDRELEAAKQRIDMKYKKRLSQVGYRGKTSLLSRRQSMLLSLFSELRGRLTAFTDTDGYREWMTGIVKNRKPEVGTVILLREDDLPLGETLSAAAGGGVSFRADTAITLGGLSLLSPDGKRCENHTLDEAFASQFREFYRNHSIGDGGDA